MACAASHKHRFHVRRLATRRALLLYGAAGLLGCSRQQDLLVFAAASLGPFLETTAGGFGKLEPTARISLNLGGSATLARQLLAAPKGDVFITAGREDLEPLVAAKLMDPQRLRTLFQNRLVLVANKRSGLRPTDPETALLAARSVISIADPAAAPLGRYSKAWLQQLNPDLWQRLGSRLSPMPDARSTVMQVERRPDALGLIYRSDALNSRQLTVLHEFRAGSGPKMEYVAGTLTRSPKIKLAEAFLQHLTGPAARRRFLELGFLATNGG